MLQFSGHHFAWPPQGRLLQESLNKGLHHLLNCNPKIGILNVQFLFWSTRGVEKVWDWSMSPHGIKNASEPPHLCAQVSQKPNDWKSPQQDSHITPAVQIINDRETLFRFIKVPKNE